MCVVADSNATPGAKVGSDLRPREAAGLVRMITPGIKAPARVPGARPAGAGDAARRSRRRWVLLLIAGWLCQAGLRVWFSRMQTVPLEIGRAHV